MLWYIRDGSVRLNDIDVRSYVLSDNSYVFATSDITYFVVGEPGYTLESVFTPDLFGDRVYLPNIVQFTDLHKQENLSGINAVTEYSPFAETLYGCKLDIDNGKLKLPERIVSMIERVVFMHTTAHEIGQYHTSRTRPTRN